MIILEDFGGDSLKTIFENKLLNLSKRGQISLSDFLILAIQITEALDQIHATNVIHYKSGEYHLESSD